VLRQIFLISFLFSAVWTYAQENGELIQLTGYVYEKETGLALPYAHILNPARNIGKVSNLDGYFTIVAYPGDTLKISNIGFTDHFHAVLPSDRHLVIEMVIDVRQLPETEVRPWPKSMLALRQDLKSREIVNATTILQQNMTKAGFNPPPAHPTPPPPSILNPVSFIYDKIIKKIQERKPKKNMIDQLPPLE
jgi:hypothetical protein